MSLQIYIYVLVNRYFDIMSTSRSKADRSALRPAVVDLNRVFNLDKIRGKHSETRNKRLSANRVKNITWTRRMIFVFGDLRNCISKRAAARTGYVERMVFSNKHEHGPSCPLNEIT